MTTTIQDRQDAADRRAAREREIRQVAAERKETAAGDPWWPIPAWEVPEGIRFSTLGRDQGQIVEVSYGTFSRAEAGPDDRYQRVTASATRRSARNSTSGARYRPASSSRPRDSRRRGPILHPTAAAWGLGRGPIRAKAILSGEIGLSDIDLES